MHVIFYLQFKLRPAAGNQEHAHAEGAYVVCFVRVNDPSDLQAAGQVAESAAAQYLWKSGWIILELQKGPCIAERWQYEDHPDKVVCFDQAVERGGCFVFQPWVADTDTPDTLH